MSDLLDFAPAAIFGVVIVALGIAQGMRKGRRASAEAEAVAGERRPGGAPPRAGATQRNVAPVRRRPATAVPGPGPARPIPADVPVPSWTVGFPAAELPTLRLEDQVAALARPPRPRFRIRGPGWAANAVIAAEIFGQPIALRPPNDGTVLPPRAL